MHARNYVETAKLLADEISKSDPLMEQSRITTVSDIARGLADIFISDNPRFDRQRFYFACGLEDDGRPHWPSLYEAAELYPIKKRD